MTALPTLTGRTPIDADLLAALYRAAGSPFSEAVSHAEWIDGEIVESATLTEVTGWRSERRTTVAVLRATWKAQPIKHFAARVHSLTAIQVIGGGRMGGEGYATQATHVYTSALSADELRVVIPALAYDLLPVRTVVEEL